jgi:hypothetical protein
MPLICANENLPTRYPHLPQTVDQIVDGWRWAMIDASEAAFRLRWCTEKAARYWQIEFDRAMWLALTLAQEIHRRDPSRAPVPIAADHFEPQDVGASA